MVAMKIYGFPFISYPWIFIATHGCHGSFLEIHENAWMSMDVEHNHSLIEGTTAPKTIAPASEKELF